MSIKKLDQLISKLEHTKSGGMIHNFAGGRKKRGRPVGSGLTGGVRRVRRMHHATCGGMIQDFTGGRRRYVRRTHGGVLTGGFTMPKLKRMISEILKHEMHKKGGYMNSLMKHIKANQTRISKYAPRQSAKVVLGSGRVKRRYTRRRQVGGEIQDFTGSALTGGKKRHYKKKSSSKKGHIPPQLKAWHKHVAEIRKEYPNTSI